MLAPLDIIILLGILLAIFVLSFKWGKGFLASLILAFYPTSLIFSNFKLFKTDSALLLAAIYLILYIIIYFILRKTIHVRESGRGFGKIFSHLVLSISALIPIFVSVLVSLPGLKQFYALSDGIHWMFLEAIPYEIVLIVPLIILFATSRFRGE